MLDLSKAKRWMAKEERALRHYVAREQQNGMVTHTRADLWSYVEGRAPIGHATVALQYLGGYEAARGGEAVLQGDTAGFAAIDLACAYRLWLVLILSRAYDLDSRPNKQPRLDIGSLAACWLHACAVGLDEVMNRLSPIVARVCDGEDILAGRDTSPTATLVAHWASGIDAANLEKRGWKKLGPYALLAGGAPTLADLEELCDEHIRQVSMDGDETLVHYPYRLIPMEVLAASRLTNIDLSESRHPLLTSPLSRPREAPALPRSDELEAVLRRAKSEFGLEEM